MNYIGSKQRLLGEIARSFARNGLPAQARILDLFAGTSAVGAWARQQGHEVWANDLMAYAHLRAQALVQAQGYPRFEALLAQHPEIASLNAEAPRVPFGPGPAPGEEATRLRQVLRFLESLRPQRGAFSEAYGEGGAGQRLYFAREVAERTQAVRDRIAAWQAAGWLEEVEFALLVSSLIESLDHLANTASVYGAHLKQLKASAKAPFALRLPHLALADGKGHRAYREDALGLLERLAREGARFDLVYLDPPYNGRRYDANYHLLESLALWDLDRFEPRGRTGLRPTSEASPFCSKRRVGQAFRDVLAAAGRLAPRVLVSYSEEALLEEDKLSTLLKDWAGPKGRTDFHSLAYQRFRADQDGEGRRYKSDGVREFLFHAERPLA